MSKIKRIEWPEDRVNRLKKVKQNSNTRTELTALATAWGIPYNKVYSRWHYENNKGNEPASKASSNGAADSTMKFFIDKSILTPKRSDTEEVARMKENLLPVAKKLEPNGGNIAIKSKMSVTAKRFLEDSITGSRWSISAAMDKGKPTGFSRLFRRK